MLFNFSSGERAFIQRDDVTRCVLAVVPKTGSNQTGRLVCLFLFLEVRQDERQGEKMKVQTRIVCHKIIIVEIYI